jgi:hypothetical protein
MTDDKDNIADLIESLNEDFDELGFIKYPNDDDEPQLAPRNDVPQLAPRDDLPQLDEEDTVMEEELPEPAPSSKQDRVMEEEKLPEPAPSSKQTLPVPVSKPNAFIKPFDLSSTTHALASFEQENHNLLRQKFKDLQELDTTIANAELELNDLKKKRTRSQLELQGLKKRKLTCNKSLVIEQKKVARQDEVEMSAVLNNIRNAHVDGECDHITTRGSKCKSRRALTVVGDKNFCPNCLLFYYKSRMG